MKKVFTLILALTVVFAGFAQVKHVSKNDAVNKKVATMKVTKGLEEGLSNVQVEPNMLRTDGELDYSTYDWQTNAGAINRTIVWPDGKVNFAYTYASLTKAFDDRGTAIGTYDSNTDTWIPLESRVETEKTGFGSIARFGDNGIVVAAHTADECGIWIIEDKDNIPAGTLACTLRLNNDMQPTWPVVMTSGAHRDIIHVLATHYSAAGNPMYYYRSSDGGVNWDKEDVVIPFLSSTYFSDWGSNIAYWMETTEDNCLAFVVNNAWSDCMVVYSYDDGETWENKVFWHHPGINTTFDNSFFYPRWTSAQWGPEGELCLVYEFNGSTGEPGSGSYYPGIGGVAFWGEKMPYYGETVAYDPDPTNPAPPTPGQPFIMDTAYIYNDIYASWWLWSDATHEMWPEYFGYLPALLEDGQPEPDPYNVQEFNIEDRSLHGAYNSGCVAMPVLCKVPGSDFDFVAVWSAMDENNVDENSSDGNFYYKLFASYSADGGRTWTPQMQLTTDFMYTTTEFVYTQAAVVGTTLVIAAQADPETGTFVQSDESNAGNNLYQGLTFELNDLWPSVGVGVPEVNHNTHMSLYPNPAVDQLNVTLSQNADIVIFNIMGQTVMNVEGHAGANSLNISELNAGVYFISAGSDTQKVIVK